MDNQVESQIGKSKTSLWKRLTISGCAVIVLCLLCGLGLFVIALYGGGGEPATGAVPERIDKEFFQAIHDGQIDKAHAMLSEKLIPQISREQFVEVIQKDEKIFSTYKYFEVCDWGFFISDGRVITSSGLLHYEGGVIVVEISLHKDNDSVWRIQGFRFRSDVDPKQFGMCK